MPDRRVDYYRDRTRRQQYDPGYDPRQDYHPGEQGHYPPSRSRHHDEPAYDPGYDTGYDPRQTYYPDEPEYGPRHGRHHEQPGYDPRQDHYATDPGHHPGRHSGHYRGHDPGYEQGYDPRSYPPAEAAPRSGYPEDGYGRAGYRDADPVAGPDPMAGPDPRAGRRRRAGYDPIADFDPRADYDPRADPRTDSRADFNPRAGSGYDEPYGDVAADHPHDPYHDPYLGRRNDRGPADDDVEDLEFFRDEPGRRRRRQDAEDGGGKSALTLVLTIAILAGLAFGGWYGFTKVRDFLSPPDYEGPGKGKVTVMVHTGDSASAIGNELYRKGVVASGAAFVNAAEDDERSRNIQPGAYELRKKMSAKHALAALLDPKNKLVDRVTVPEGASNVQVFKSLSKQLDIPLKEFTDLNKKPESFGIDKSWFTRSDKEKAPKSLEGFLYPSTYEFDPDTTAAQALQAMVDKFLAVAKELDLQNVAQQKGITPYEAVIVASLGEAEVIPKDLGKVTRVIYNRLNHDDAWMRKLQFDSTTNYWLEKQGKKRKDSSGLTRAELNDPDNPYSTHAHPGLPPGPIGNPSAKALEAAVNPEKGDWLYFVVVEKDGSSAFSSTLAEHERNVNLCKKRKLGC